MTTARRWKFYLHYAVRSLRREGIRTLLAGMSIAFGVLSLIAMQSLSSTLLLGAMFDEQLMLGGDAQISSAGVGQPLNGDELAQIAEWQEQDLIAASTHVSDGSADYIRTPRSGRVTYILGAMGFEPTSYPLIGELLLREPAGLTPVDVLREPTDALLTRDLADNLGLRVGDMFLIGGGSVTPTHLTVAGIVRTTPDQRGRSVFYTLETARLLENRADVITTVRVMWGDAAGAAQTVIDSPMMVYVARTPEQLTTDSSARGWFEMMLQGAGVLGLLVGGLGVSNTLQVILARRKLEIAMLKTLGFRQRHLFTLIGLETGLLGLIGSIVGAVLGAALGGKLLDLLGGAGTFLVNWSPDSSMMIGGVLAGTVTAIVFGLQSILVSSATRPVELLRELPIKPTRRIVVGRAALFTVLIMIFGALVGVVLGSILSGIVLVIGGGALLLVLRGAFALVLWAVLKLPLPPLPMLRLARANLRRRKIQSSLVVIALFAGAFSVTFAALMIYNAQKILTDQRLSDAGYNLMVFTSAGSANEISGQIITQGADALYTRYLVNGMMNNEPITIEGRRPAELEADVSLDETWDGDPSTALLPGVYAERYSIGDSLTLVTDAATLTLELAGFYNAIGSYDSTIALTANGLIVAPETAFTLGGERTQVSIVARFPVERLNAATDTLGTSLPDALVFSKVDLNDLIVSTFQALFTFAVSVAGLAFVAGAVLIANSASLTVVERRREIGVFKAVGYTSGHVLRLLVGEYGFLGLLSGIFGVIAAIAAITLINVTQQSTLLVIDPFIVVSMVFVSVAIAAGSAAVVAWQPTHVRPLDVLRYE